MQFRGEIAEICTAGEQEGALKGMKLRQRFDWLVAPRSASLQTSPVHCGCAEDPEAALEALFDRLVRIPR